MWVCGMGSVFPPVSQCPGWHQSLIAPTRRPSWSITLSRTIKPLSTVHLLGIAVLMCADTYRTLGFTRFDLVSCQSTYFEFILRAHKFSKIHESFAGITIYACSFFYCTPTTLLLRSNAMSWLYSFPPRFILLLYA